VWAEELEKWLPHLRPGAVRVIEGREDRISLQAAGEGGNGTGSSKAAKGKTQQQAAAAEQRRGDEIESAEAAAAGSASAADGLSAVAKDPDAIRALMPSITITSYEMMKRLSCDACQKGIACSAPGAVTVASSRGRGGRGGRGRGQGRGATSGGEGDEEGGGGGASGGGGGGGGAGGSEPLHCAGPGELCWWGCSGGAGGQRLPLVLVLVALHRSHSRLQTLS